MGRSFTITRSATPTGDVEYTWDPAGRRIAETGNRRTRRYRYDGLGRTSAIDTTTNEVIGTITDALPVLPGERWHTRLQGLDLPGMELQVGR